MLIKKNRWLIDFFKKQYFKKTVYTYICIAKLEVLLRACESKNANYKIQKE